MTDLSATETDPSVCYRHPGRQSWVLCQRCGRTICPECQILAPVGVQCPECVREAGGSGTWNSSGSARKGRSGRSRSRSGGAVQSYLISNRGPHLSWILVGVTSALWLVGFFTNNLPFALLASGQGPWWQIWRFGTSFLADFSVPNAGGILLYIVGAALLAWFGPFIEQMLGRSRFAFFFLVGSIFGGAVGVLAGGQSWGLSPGLYAVFVVYGVTASRRGANVVLLWALMAFNILYTAVANIGALPQLVAGAFVGLGLWWLFDSASRPSSRSKVVITWATTAAIVVLAIGRLAVYGG